LRTNVHERFTVAVGDERLGAVLAEIDERTGRTTRIEGIFAPLPATPS
jgi:calcineurin-like phosphoesterase